MEVSSLSYFSTTHPALGAREGQNPETQGADKIKTSRKDIPPVTERPGKGKLSKTEPLLTIPALLLPNTTN